MFGGFDGEFYNDLNVLSLQQDVKSTMVSASTRDSDYLSLVNSEADHDIVFTIENENKSAVVYAHRCLILFRLFETEKIGNVKSSFLKLVEN